MSANESEGLMSPEEAFGGWPGMDLGGGQDAGDEGAPAEEATTSQDAAPAPVEEAPVADEAPSEGDATPAEELPEWKRYGFADENAMWTSYKELQRTLTAQRQAPAEAEEEEVEEAPPPGWKSHQYEALGEIPRVGLSAPQREQLADLMQADPKAAALWAHQNRQYMEPQDFKAVQNNWAQSDPEEYWEFKNALQTYQMQAERAEEEASRNAYVLEQQRTGAINDAKAALPIMEERSEEFGKWLEAPENRDISNMLDGIQDPGRLRNALVSAFYQFAGPQLYQELVQSHQQAAQLEAERQAAAEAAAQQQAQTGRRASTQTRTAAASTPASEGDADDAIRARIANPYGTS